MGFGYNTGNTYSLLNPLRGYQEIVTLYDSFNTVKRKTISGLTYNLLPTDSFIGITSTIIAPVSITLPLANSVISGRFYEFKDEGLNSSQNHITFYVSGSDLIENDQTSVVAALDGISLIFYSDGINKWYIK